MHSSRSFGLSCVLAPAVSFSSSRSPLTLAVFTVLLDWPDVTQPLRYFTGFKAVGSIEPTGVFREIPHTLHVPEDEFLGQHAQDFVQELVHRKPSSDAQAIWELTQEECAKGWCSGPFSVAQLDQKFGPGRWRPVPRFRITQASGKQRLIDDAKQGSHNLATDMEETIFTIGIDSLPVYVRRLALVVMHFCGELPPWFLPTACIMDLPDAYRGCPVDPRQRGLTIAATFDPVNRRWCFWVYTGLLYGLASAVLSFNRLPTLLVAAARRLLAVACGAYFDDLFDVAVRSIASASQTALLHILSLAGAPPAPDKTQPPRANFGYLGASFDFSMVFDEGTITCGPMQASPHKLFDAVELATESRQLTPAQASKLRGQAGWTGSLLHGKCGRLALRFLKERQYAKDGDSSPSHAQLRELQLLLHIAKTAPIRTIEVLKPPSEASGHLL